jgi:hypothetical protein
MIDCRNGGKAECTGREPALLVELEDEKLDPARVFAFDLMEEIVEERRQGPVRPMVIGFSPPGNAFAGLDLDEQARTVIDPLHVGF